MKKSLIALAIASAVSAPSFAATSNVDVYGKLNMSFSVLNDETLSASSNQVSSTGSRIGFKGTEDLGSGLAAIWQIESGINLDEQNGTWASRNSFVGLKGGFGTALIGNHDTPLKLVGRAVDLFPDTLADSRNVMGVGSDTRGDNVVAYISPTWTGFSFAAAYSNDPVSAATTAADADDVSLYNLSATYTNGGLFLGLGYGDGDYHEANGLGAQYRLAAGFTFGDFKIVGQYDKLEDDSTTVGTQVGDYDAWMLGGSYTMGAMVFKANYMEGESDAATADREQWTIGMDYNLSKRTAVYVLYVDGQNVTLGGGAGSSDQIAGAAVTGDDDVSAISLGVSHSF
ncbi:MAG: porin [Thiobacillus sp.]|nr:porin [Thiobacillus sp.]